MGKLTSFITPQDWLQLSVFCLIVPGILTGFAMTKIFNVACSHQKLLKKRRLPSEREHTLVALNHTCLGKDA